jgi:hypothetical protein
VGEIIAEFLLNVAVNTASRIRRAFRRRRDA